MKNNLLTDTLSYRGDFKEKTTVDIITYDYSGVEISEEAGSGKIAQALDSGRTTWVRVSGLSEVDQINSISDMAGLDFLSKQDILNMNHPVKIEIREDYIIFILKLFHQYSSEAKKSGDTIAAQSCKDAGECNGDEFTTEMTSSQLAVALNSHSVFTFSESADDSLDEIIKAIQKNIFKIRSKGSDYLADVILNHIIGNYITVLMKIDSELDDIESDLVSGSADMELMLKIQKERKDFLLVKQVLLPLKDEYYKLLRADTELLDESNRMYLADINDHIQYCLQQYETHRDTISALIDMYKSNNELKMNSIMKKLTLISTIFIPLTFLAGIWGMNFEYIPELKWKWGYLFAWITMIVTAVILYIFIRKKKWE